MVERRPRRAVVGELVPGGMSEIADLYLDVWGKPRTIDPQVRQALEKALGPALPHKKVKIEKGRCHQPACRNVEVTRVTRSWPAVMRAGTAPHRTMYACGSGWLSSIRNTITLIAMSA